MEKVRIIVLCVFALSWCASVSSTWTLPRVGRYSRFTSTGSGIFRFNNTRTARQEEADAPVDDPADGDVNPAPIAFPKSPDFCTDCTCGAGRKTRIVGGSVTSFHEFPWMVGILKHNKFHCGGSLITRRHVLTAAHCLEGFNSKSFDLYLGVTDISSRGPTTLRRKVASWSVHENYNGYNLDNDIGVIEMDRAVSVDGHVRTGCLPENSVIDYTGSLATAIGWGRTEEEGDISKFLRKVKVPVLSDEECDESGYPKARRTDNMFCAGYLDGERDSCSGDSGGPLLAQAPAGHYEIIGITSFGRGCARPRYPGVYTKLTNYLGWLRDQLDGECICPSPGQF